MRQATLTHRKIFSNFYGAFYLFLKINLLLFVCASVHLIPWSLSHTQEVVNPLMWVLGG